MEVTVAVLVRDDDGRDEVGIFWRRRIYEEEKCHGTSKLLNFINWKNKASTNMEEDTEKRFECVWRGNKFCSRSVLETPQRSPNGKLGKHLVYELGKELHWGK